MDTITNLDNPGDCQSKNASPKVVGNENNSPSAAVAATATQGGVGGLDLTTTKHGKAANIGEGKQPCSAMALATNKLKSQQQQQQSQPPQQHQHHLFRAPQQFVKHKKASSSSATTHTSTTTAHASSLNSSSNNNNSNNKKNKCWNKRQNRTAKQNAGTTTISSTTSNTSNSNNVSSSSSSASPPANSVLSRHSTSEENQGLSAKADVENIQNLKNQVGGHNYYHNYHQQQHHAHHAVGGGAAVANESRLGLSMSADKLGYGHGHLKPQQQQQLHKKPLPAHRGGGGHNHNQHHHHILCAGSAHNTMGSGGGGGGSSNASSGSGGGGAGSLVNANNMSCCHINGCGSHTGKDGQSSVNNSTSSNPSSTLHFCCLRSKFFLPDKRPRKGNFIPPTKFLLGGNISDPLNLSSLQNEASSASANTTPATTPRQSPITTPPKVEVIIPPNIHDPLHLLDPVDSMEYEKQLTSPMKRGCLLGLPVSGVGASIILGLRAQNKSHKHRHRKYRKPKRKRFDSFNSTTSTQGDPLEDLTPSALINASTSTEKGFSSSTSMLSVSLDLENKSQHNNEGCSSGGSGAGDDDDVPERNLCSPLQLSLSHNTDTKVAYSVDTKSPPQQEPLTVDSSTAIAASSTSAGAGVGGGSGAVVGPNVCVAVGAGCVAGGASGVIAGDLRERACRDLRLDLISTTSGSTTSCGSSVVSSTGGGGRKRKISESNNSQKSKKYFRNDSMDKIVSPVVPQPGAWKRPPRTTATGARKSSRRSTSISESINADLSPVEENAKVLVEEIPTDDTPELIKMDSTSDVGLLCSPLSTASGATSINAGEVETTIGELPTESGDTSNALNLAEKVKTELAPLKTSKHEVKPKFSADGPKYRFGNYDRYAGLRHLNEFMDIRLQVFLQYPELFKNKDILDIGCNVGHMTISVARKLSPKTILGIDIDKELVSRARRNLAMYVRLPPEVWKKEIVEMDDSKEIKDVKVKTGRRRRKKKKVQVENQQNNNLTNWHQFQHHHLMHYHQLLHHHHHHHHHHHQHHHHHPGHKMQTSENSNINAAEFFPISFPLNYGGITQPTAKATSPQNLESQSPASTSTATRSTPGHTATGGGNKANNSSTTVKPQWGRVKNDFPQNVFFRQTNYVLKDENLLANDTQQYDLILCLSVTKWIHLNFGDGGLKSAFKRMFNQLRPGGKLILEAQNWASYKKKKNLTEDVYNSYNNIEFFPNKFHEYLLSSEVGFSHSYTLGIPKHLSKGFSRPIQLYAKGDYTPNHVRWSDAYYPQTPFEAYRGIYATMPPRPTGMQSSYPLISSSRSQNYDTPHYMGGGGASGPYSCRQTPMHQHSTSQYYNPLESDSYQPSYDMEYLNHMYVFASPLYQTVWSPPTSMRKSSSHTPVFGSVRDAEFEGDGNAMSGGSYHRHVYPPNDETSSPNANAINAFNSIRDPDTDDSNQQRPHVYATTCEISSSPHPHNLNQSDTEEVLMLDEESRPNCCDSSET